MDVSESALDAIVVISKMLVIEAEEVEECWCVSHQALRAAEVIHGMRL